LNFNNNKLAAAASWLDADDMPIDHDVELLAAGTARSPGRFKDGVARAVDREGGPSGCVAEPCLGKVDAGLVADPIQSEGRGPGRVFQVAVQ
jgi:hypothetical protein